LFFWLKIVLFVLDTQPLGICASRSTCLQQQVMQVGAEESKKIADDLIRIVR